MGANPPPSGPSPRPTRWDAASAAGGSRRDQPAPAANPRPSLGVLEKPLEKKSGRNFGPPGTKKLIYFIDDMNMPEVDKYGTVAPHTLIRQHMDHGHW